MQTLYIDLPLDERRRLLQWLQEAIQKAADPRQATKEFLEALDIVVLVSDILSTWRACGFKLEELQELPALTKNVVNPNFERVDW